MPAEPASDVKFEIGHVLFIDIVGYSKLLINEQSAQLETLKKIVRGTEQFRFAEAEGKLLRLPTGDGGALVFRTNPEAPVLCAAEIGSVLKNHPELRVRMGIHSGPVNEISDLNEQANIAGAGINIAQRVMDCGDAGHILLSKHVADDLEHYPRWRPYLHELGECEVKHGVRIGVVNFYGDDSGNPQVPKQVKVLRNHRARTRWTAIAAALLLLIGVATAFVIVSKKSPQSISTIPEKSIAVLPFENLSRDPDNAYFADGIQDEILARLSKIADLKVISRTSTQKYKSAPDNLREIAKQLGVSSILEGSVQKAADQVRVNVQLINALNDAHLWSEIYDRKLTDIFVVESDIAKTIADTLQAKLSGSEHQAIAARPTENVEAHELYLKGRYFGGKRTADDLQRAIDYYNQALAKDPNYAAAYAGIANSYILLPEYSKVSPAEAFPKAQAAAARALAIDDKLGDAHAALGLVMVSADFNFKEARLEFERAIELNPNSAEAHYFFGISVLLPLGQLDQAIAEIKQAITLDPFSVIMNANLGLAYTMARRYPEAISQLRKTAELDPSSRQVHSRLGSALLLSGDVPGAIAEYEKQRESARKEGQGREYYAIGFLAHLYGVSGNREKASELFDEVKQLEKHAGLSAYLNALIQIGLGNKEEAIDWLERSYQAKEQAWFKVDPMVDPLRGDPRFEELVQKVVGPKQK